jgi:hypothetical protein
MRGGTRLNASVTSRIPVVDEWLPVISVEIKGGGYNYDYGEAG